MKYRFLKYTEEHAALAESFFDEEARKMTGCEDGWADYYGYFLSGDAAEKLEEDFFVRLIFLENLPVGIIAFGVYEGVLTVSEIAVSSELRGKGHGSAILTELLEEYTAECDISYERARAVIFPGNRASEGAFIKAGFVFESTHPDGDAIYYIYKNRIKK